MQIQENVSLKLYSTMRLGGNARYVCTVTNETDLLEALEFAQTHNVPHRVIGKGSNIIWRDEGYSGLLIINEIVGYEVINETTITFGSGHEWDNAVNISVELGLSGLETLSHIPGTVGATPVQNVGAYGQEIANVMTQLRAYDCHQKKFVTLHNNECAFGYRTSRFKTTDSNRFIITSVTFELSKTPLHPPFYESLQTYLETNTITDYSPASIRRAVIAIRSDKLPNPNETANNGSFFANPIVSTDTYTTLVARYPDIKAWKIDDQSYKLAAGWLIQKAGFNNINDVETGMATWPGQNLVIINKNARSTEQLLVFTQKIVTKVQEMFGVTLQQEPELLP